MSLAANAPHAFALLNLDAGSVLERGRFRDATAAALKAIPAPDALEHGA
jgi:hypothetical protein